MKVVSLMVSTSIFIDFVSPNIIYIIHEQSNNIKQNIPHAIYHTQKKH